MGNGAHLVYQGPLGQILCEGASFFASKDGVLLGTYKTYDEAIEKLARKGRAKAQQTPLVNAHRTDGTKRRIKHDKTFCG